MRKTLANKPSPHPDKPGGGDKPCSVPVHPRFEKYLPGIGKVFQTPVVGCWEHGPLQQKAWGKAGWDLLAQVLDAYQENLLTSDVSWRRRGRGMAWDANHFRLFISHVSAFHVQASDLATFLRESYGVHAFVAHADIEPSADWQNEIEASLKTMDALVALLSPGFSASLWCNQEVGWALGRGSLAIAVRLGEDPRGFVGRFQAVPGGDGKLAGVAERVFKVLAAHPATAARIGVTTSQFLQRANSWEQFATKSRQP